MQQEKKKEQSSLNTEGEVWATGLEKGKKKKKELEHEAQSEARVSKGLDTVTITFAGLILFICVLSHESDRDFKKTLESTCFLLQHK